jgi:hypothetical protein
VFEGASLVTSAPHAGTLGEDSFDDALAAEELKRDAAIETLLARRATRGRLGLQPAET